MLSLLKSRPLTDYVRFATSRKTNWKSVSNLLLGGSLFKEEVFWSGSESRLLGLLEPMATIQHLSAKKYELRGFGIELLAPMPWQE